MVLNKLLALLSIKTDSHGEHLDDELMAAYCEDSLNGQEKKTAIEHLSQCDECYQKWSNVSLAFEACQEQVKSPIKIKNRGHFSWLFGGGVVAVAMSVFAIVVFSPMLMNNQSDFDLPQQLRSYGLNSSTASESWPTVFVSKSIFAPKKESKNTFVSEMFNEGAALSLGKLNLNGKFWDKKKKALEQNSSKKCNESISDKDCMKLRGLMHEFAEIIVSLYVACNSSGIDIPTDFWRTSYESGKEILKKITKIISSIVEHKPIGTLLNSKYAGREKTCVLAKQILNIMLYEI